MQHRNIDTYTFWVIVGFLCTVIIISYLQLCGNLKSSIAKQGDTVERFPVNRSQPKDAIHNLGGTKLNIIKSDLAYSTKRFKYVKPYVVEQLYQLMYIADKVLSDNNIDYWCEGGTLLGAIRHRGIIPWDDDGDFHVWDSDRSNLEALRNVFAKYDIILMDTWFGYKMFFSNAEPIKGFQWLYPSIDIFPVKLDENKKMMFSYPETQRIFAKYLYDYETLYPLKRYKFGSFHIWGPGINAVKPYLDRCYGNDWNTHAYLMFDHRNEKMIKSAKIKLLPSEKSPAQPIEFIKPMI